MTEQPASSGIRTLAVRLPEELNTQLILVASLDGVPQAEVVRKAVEEYITRRRDSGDLAARAQAALDQVDREAEARRAALAALLGPEGGKPPTAPDKATTRAREPKSGG
jgi:predicted DNA-binding protein